MQVSTRTATDSDLPFLCEADEHVSREDQAQVVSQARVMIADVGGTAVGLLRWGLFWDQVPFMNLLWVAPKRRGHGIGTTLAETWERTQLAAGHELVLTSTMSNETSQHLYRRLGYVDCGALFMPDEPAELILRKALA